MKIEKKTADFINDRTAEIKEGKDTLTQRRNILLYLQGGNRLTPLQALTMFGTLRLSGHVFVLRERGHSIKTTMIAVKGRSGKISHVARYSMTQVSFLD